MHLLYDRQIPRQQLGLKIGMVDIRKMSIEEQFEREADPGRGKQVSFENCNIRILRKY